ncbi:GTPase IMAP family member 4 [Biomphalaria glabrata]
MAEGFKVWRQEQGGYFKQLRLQCQDLVILFDNVTQSAIVRTKQMKKLIKCVRKLNTDGIRYTDKRFQRAKQSRDYLLCENQMVQVDKGLDEVTIILEQYSVIVDDDFSYPSEDLKEISVKCDALFDQFSKSQDESSTVKEFLKMVVEVRNSSFKFSQNFKEIHQKLTINRADDSAGNTRVLADDNQGIKRSKVIGYSDACITTSEGETLRKRSTSVTSEKRVVSSKELKDQVIGEFVDNNAIQKLYATEKELKYQLAAIKNEMKLEIQKYRTSHKLIQEKRDNILRAKSACQIL